MAEQPQVQENDAPIANEEAGRVVLSIPEQAELAEESDIEFEDSPGVPGQIQYPNTGSMSQYSAEGKDVDEDPYAADDPRSAEQVRHNETEPEEMR